MRRATIGTVRGTAIAGAALPAVLAGALATASPFAAHGQQTDQPPRMLASNGAVIEMPEVETLDCAGIAEALRRLDLSDYRSGTLVPADHPDRPIFDYEDRLARRHYTDCVLRDHAFGDPGEAFSFGFEPQ